ncbi:MAG: hypothetical protein H6706_30185 [Myxococcales bacterium]|nr:hypothetical protein [Myxococcales bacterium]
MRGTGWALCALAWAWGCGPADEAADAAEAPAADAGVGGLRPVERVCDPSQRWALPIVEPARLQGVTPLGYQNGDAHILPLHVMYFHGREVDGPDGRTLDPAVIDTPLRVGGDVTITSIEVARDNGASPPIEGEDWFIVVRPCRDARVRFHHLNRPSAQVFAGIDLDALRDGQWPGARCQHNDAGALRSCALKLDIDVPAGTEIARVFRPAQWPFNLSVYRDPFPGDGLAEHGVDGSVGRPIRPERYHLTWADVATRLGAALDEGLFRELNPSRSRGRCPLDVFDASVRAGYEALLGSPDGSTRSEGGCGHIFVDVPDTLAGAWFPVGVEPINGPTFFDERVTLVLMADALDPSHQVVMAPSLSGGRGRGGFQPDEARAPLQQQPFDAVRFGAADPEPTYCWDDLGTFSVEAPAGKLRVRFETATRIQAEWVAGDVVCGPDEAIADDAPRFER